MEEGRVTSLIEKATKSTAQEIDPRLLKSIKSTVRYSDSEIRLASQTLTDLMKHNNSQVRYLSLLIIDELFMRSKLFRSLTIENLDNLLSLSIGFRIDSPLPAPPAIATILRTKGLELLEKWNLSYGLRYKQLRLGFDYLKNTLKMKFPDVQTNNARLQRERLKRETKTKEILRSKFDSLREKFGVLRNEIDKTVKEIKECIEIVKWRDDDGVPLAILDEEDYEEIRCSHLRQIRLESLAQSDKVEETKENRVVFDVLREQFKVLMTKHLVSVEEGISLVIRVDVTDNRVRDSMLKNLIDVKNEILGTKKKCDEAGFTMISRVKEDTSDDDEDIWEDDNVTTDASVVVPPVTIIEPKPSIEVSNTSTNKVLNTEIPPCNAPLAKGGLCQRRDLRICPFHGAIVSRDSEGKPINKTNEDVDIPMEESALDSGDNQLVRQIAEQALRNIRGKDKKEMLKIVNKANLAKVREHNFTVLRDAAMASTSRSAVVDEEFDRVFAERKNKKQTRRKTTTKDRLTVKLFNNRGKGAKPGNR